jgi:hypothetical protein
MMNARHGMFAAVLVAGLCAAALPAQAAPSAARITQPYRHLVAAGEWGTGGTYVSHDGTIEMSLTKVPHVVKAFVESCSGGSDLGAPRKFPAAKASRRVLAKDVPAGTCFLLEFSDPTGKGGFLVKGELSY